MKMFMLLFSFFYLNFATATEPAITELRTLYDQAASSKSAAKQLLTLLKPVDDQSNPLLICYKGAAEMMQAKYGLNPVNKLSRFKAGKELIEKAIKKAPEEAEIRFLRFTIQTNLPSFLGYNDNIKEDKELLLAKQDKLKDKVLKQNIAKYLSASKHCSEEEKKGLKI